MPDADQSQTQGCQRLTREQCRQILSGFVAPESLKRDWTASSSTSSLSTESLNDLLPRERRVFDPGWKRHADEHR